LEKYSRKPKKKNSGTNPSKERKKNPLCPGWCCWFTLATRFDLYIDNDLEFRGGTGSMMSTTMNLKKF
jgi:hypothetical protein